MTTPNITEQIEACERFAKAYDIGTPTGDALRAAAEMLRKVRDGELVPKHEHYWVATGLGNESMACMQCGEPKP